MPEEGKKKQIMLRKGNDTHGNVARPKIQHTHIFIYLYNTLHQVHQIPSERERERGLFFYFSMLLFFLFSFTYTFIYPFEYILFLLKLSKEKKSEFSCIFFTLQNHKSLLFFFHNLFYFSTMSMTNKKIHWTVGSTFECLGYTRKIVTLSSHCKAKIGIWKYLLEKFYLFETNIHHYKHFNNTKKNYT